MRAIVLGILCSICATLAQAQAISDVAVDISVASPAFPRDTGPVVAVDAAHFNYHKLDGRFEPFAGLLRNDGFRLVPFADTFTVDSLKTVQVLVISNALNKVNVGNWKSPMPSAFSPEEIAALKSWVSKGGALLLIADHIPFAGAASDLGAAFGFSFRNAYAQPHKSTSSDAFTLEEGSLKDAAALRGRTAAEAVRKVVTFTGSAFTAPVEATPILVLPKGFELLLPTDANRVTAETPREDGSGLLQGAIMNVGKGRIAVFGEAAMFSAQRLGPAAEPMGFNAPEAGGNKQFILNLLRWLGTAA
jgi:hypothetical protein